MHKFNNLNKIINGEERADIELTVGSIHTSSITHEPIVLSSHAKVNGVVDMKGGIRLVLKPDVCKKLHLCKGETLTMNGLLHHNKYCYWVADPKDIHKHITKEVLKRLKEIKQRCRLPQLMAKYIQKHQIKATHSFMKMHKNHKRH